MMQSRPSLAWSSCPTLRATLLPARPVSFRLPTIFLLVASLFTFLLAPGHIQAKNTTQSNTTKAKQYRLAKAYYHNLLANKTLAEARPNWLQGIGMFRRLHSATGADPKIAPLSLFMVARMYEHLAKHTHNPLDASEALISYEDLVARYPKHRLADDALYGMATMYQDFHQEPHVASGILAKLIAVYPQGDMANAAQARLKAMKKPVITEDRHDAHQAVTATGQCKPAEVRPIRYWSNNNYTRVIIETSVPVTFRKYELGKSGNLPRRLYLDLVN